MKKIYLLLIITITLTLVSAEWYNPFTWFISSSSEETSDTISYTDSSKTICNNGICNVVLYSGNMFYNDGNGYKEINTSFVPYSINGYDMHLYYSLYDFRVKDNSNYGDGTQYCINDSGIEYCLIYQPSDMSYKNEYNSQDYISSISGVNAIYSENKVTYQNIYSDVNLTIIANNEILKELYILGSKPRTPQTWLGNTENITLDFGGYIKYGNLEVWSNGIRHIGDFKTYEKIEFKNTTTNTTIFYLPKPLIYDSDYNEIYGEYQVINQGGQIYFYVKTPYSFLENATYPVYIDPTIQLQDADTENIGDAYLDEHLPTYNYGDTTTCLLRYSSPDYVDNCLIKFNISSLDFGNINVSDIELYYRIVANGLDSSSEGFYIGNYMLYNNYTWEELTVNWNSRPISSQITNNCSEDKYIYGGTGEPLGDTYVNMSTCINYIDFNSGSYKNVSIYLISKDPFGSPDTGDALQLATKEHATTSYHPYLSITYEEIGDTTPPIYSSASNNNTVAGTLTKFSILWNDYIALNNNGQYIFSTNNTGTWVNDSAVNFTTTPSWANVTKTLNSSVGKAIGYRWYAKDDARNWNDSGIQVLTTTQDYQVQISYPTTSNPKSVSDGDNISINFNFLDTSGSNITSSVTLGNITIGGEYATLISSGSSASSPLINVAGTTYLDQWNLTSGSTTSPDVGNSMTLSGGAAFTSGGMFYYGMSFDGADSCLDDASSTGAIDGSSSSWTIQTWMKPADVSGSKTIWEEGGSSLGYILFQENAEIGCGFRVSSGSTKGTNYDYAITTDSPLSAGNWVFVTCVANGTHINIYVNNSLDVAYAESLGSVSNPGDGMTWGCNNNVPIANMGTGDYNGVLDSFRILTNARSSSDIATDYQSSSVAEEFAYISGVGWKANVTVPTGLTGLQNLFLNATYSGNTRSDIQSNAINYGSSDTCTYTSGNWAVDCSDNCVISSPVDLGGNDITIIGTGTFTTSADITNYNKLHIEGTDSSNKCMVTCIGGCFK